MCRWITVLSSADDMSLSDVVLAPHNSLVQLSRDASFHPGYKNENNHITNGDGFGIGWYHSNIATLHKYPSRSTEEVDGHDNLYAAVFRDTAPAWNNANLREICVATRSRCILAHVRAASRFASVTQENCHPFKCGRLLFCHNGRIDKFPRVRRAVLGRLTDSAFQFVKGTTDSECLFALVLTFLEEDGKAVDKVEPKDQDTPFGHSRLVQAVKKTYLYVEKLIQAAISDGRMTDYTFSTMNFSLADGVTAVVTRFCDKSPDVLPPSLYFAYGNMEELIAEITSKNPEEYVMSLNKNVTDSDTAAETDSDEPDDPVSDAASAVSSTTNLSELPDDFAYDEMPIALQMRESLPGLNFGDVNPAEAAFVVSSNPLTKTHTWNPMPRNSIMWCTRGKMPELRLLRSKKSNSRSIVSEHTIVL
jgi:glutamine amidotransferase